MAKLKQDDVNAYIRVILHAENTWYRAALDLKFDPCVQKKDHSCRRVSSHTKGQGEGEREGEHATERDM